jgi:hypothetical protein
MAGDANVSFQEPGSSIDWKAISNVATGVSPGGAFHGSGRMSISSLLPVSSHGRVAADSIGETEGRLPVQSINDRPGSRSYTPGKIARANLKTFLPAALNGRRRRWLVSAQVRYTDQQFEDDQNLRGRTFTTVDMAVDTLHVSAALRVENLFDTEIETGKSVDGLVSIGAPRLISLRVQWQL